MTLNGMRTWAGIVRVSSMGSRRAGAADFHADRDQVALIKGALPKGDALDLLPAELNVSGGLPLEQRPSLLAAVEGVEGGTYAGIIVGYLSRLGRNVREQLRTYDRVHAAGGRIIVAQEGIDARTRSGRLQRNILAAIHEDEREMHVERFDSLRRWATEAGIWQRRQAPTGYRRDPDTRRLVPDDRTAGLVRWAFSARAAGTVPVVAIADRLGMTNSGTRYLLANRVYLGELIVGPYTNPAAHPPLVDGRTFEAAQRSVARPPRRRREPALLAGLVRCASCGHRMTRGGSARLSVYVCPKHHSGAHCPAPAAVTLALLDAHVERIALAELARLSVLAGANTGLERAQDEVRAAHAELDAYVEAVSAVEIGVEAFAAGARQRRTQLERARDELRAQMAFEPAIGVAPGGAEVWRTLSAGERNTLLRGLLRAVIVARAGGRGSRTPLTDRVRVLAYDAEFELPDAGGGMEPLGIQPIQLPDLDEPGVLRMPMTEDRLQDGRRVDEM